MISAPYKQLEAEHRFVEHLRSRFEDDGFTFQAYPPVAQLPQFLDGYQPDAIAQKGDQKVAIEIKSRQTPVAEKSLRRIRQLFDGHSDWQLRVIFMGADPQEAVTIAASTPAAIRERIAEASELLNQNQRRAAFVAAWSLLEAAFRSVGDAPKGRSYSPGTVLQTLAMSGKITPDMEHQMRELIGLRNRIVHGDLEAEPTDGQVALVLSAIQAALNDAVP